MGKCIHLGISICFEDAYISEAVASSDYKASKEGESLYFRLLARCHAINCFVIPSNLDTTDWRQGDYTILYHVKPLNCLVYKTMAQEVERLFSDHKVPGSITVPSVNMSKTLNSKLLLMLHHQCVSA